MLVSGIAGLEPRQSSSRFYLLITPLYSLSIEVHTGCNRRLEMRIFNFAPGSWRGFPENKLSWQECCSEIVSEFVVGWRVQGGTSSK